MRCLASGPRHYLLAAVLALASCLQTPLFAQTAKDSAIARTVKASRDSILCTTSASLRQQRACVRLDSLRTALLAPPPAPIISVVLTATRDTVTAAGTPGHLSFLTVQIKNAIFTVIGDSALVTLNPTGLLSLWWNPNARRWEVYNATGSGTVIATATYSGVSSTYAFVAVGPGTPPSPPAPVSRITVGFDYETTTLWPRGLGAFGPSGREVLCATVTVQGVAMLGSSAVEATYVSPDSITVTPRSETGAALHTLCGLALTGTYPIAWARVPIQVASGAPLLALPFASAVVP